MFYLGGQVGQPLMFSPAGTFDLGDMAFTLEILNENDIACVHGFIFGGRKR